MDARTAHHASRDELIRAMSGSRKVILLKHYGEVHCYLLSVGAERARVIWVSASGKVRRRDVGLDGLILPTDEHPWRGIDIPWASRDIDGERRNGRLHGRHRASA
jgi:hypothetical protein